MNKGKSKYYIREGFLHFDLGCLEPEIELTRWDRLLIFLKLKGVPERKEKDLPIITSAKLTLYDKT